MQKRCRAGAAARALRPGLKGSVIKRQRSMAASIIAAHFFYLGHIFRPEARQRRAHASQNQALAQAKNFLHYRIQVTAAGAHGVDDRINIILDGTGFFNLACS